MTTNTVCRKFKQVIEEAITHCADEHGRVALHHMVCKIDSIIADNTMLNWYYPRLDGYIEALFFADSIDEEQWMKLNDIMNELAGSHPA